jgi:hypothetical protein
VQSRVRYVCISVCVCAHVRSYICWFVFICTFLYACARANVIYGYVCGCPAPQPNIIRINMYIGTCMHVMRMRVMRVCPRICNATYVDTRIFFFFFVFI